MFRRNILVENDRKSSRRIVQWLFVILLLFLALLVLLVILQLTESVLSIWQILNQLSPNLLLLYALGLVGFTVATVVVSLLLLRRGVSSKSKPDRQIPLPKDREDFVEALKKANAKGVNTDTAQKELQELDLRKQETLYYVAFFGAVSAGKSALIRAITNTPEIKVDPRAGTTQSIHHHRFEADGAIDLILTDAPGILDINKEHVRLAREEARRAHLVVYVCDGELTRDEHRELLELSKFERTVILALNKLDRYHEEELLAIIQRIETQFPGMTIVPVQAGGNEEVIVIDAKGQERRLVRQRPAQVNELVSVIQKKITTEAAVLTQQRDESLIQLGAEKLQVETQRHRQEQSEKLVKQYTRKAMLGAMAAVSPGTDLLIQGYLGVQMVKSLCELFGVRVSEVDQDKLIERVSQNVGKKMTLLLTLAGNILKAFPGIGTVTGGIAHAIAYGMIFEALGRAIIETLGQSDRLDMSQVLDNFEEELSGNLEERAKYFARIAVEQFIQKR
jgi:small GTP-binding protein